MKARVLASVVVALATSSGPARGAGYAINDQGARAMAQGLVVSALLDGPETVFYNPAGVAAIDGLHLSTGLTSLFADFDARPEETPDIRFASSRDRFQVPHLAFVAGLGERWTVGVGVNAPYGLATEWPEDFPGRFTSRIADLKTAQLGVVLAARLPRGWSVGFGPTWTHGDVRLVRHVDLSVFRNGHEAVADLAGDGGAWAYRLGTRWEGASGLRFGAALHGETDLSFGGTVDYTVEPLGAFSLDQAIMTLFQDGPAATTLTLPAVVTVGLGRVAEPWSWGADLTWTHWSVMQSVIVDLEPIEAGGQELVIEEFVVNDWHDTWALRLGARRRVSERWSWAAGAYWDQSPVPLRTVDPLLPDSDRLSVTGGATWRGRRLTLDVAGQLVFFEGADSRGTENEFPAAYESSVLALAVTFGWRWGGGSVP